MLYRSTAALATMAVALAVSGTAMADPYADEVISFNRVTTGVVWRNVAINTDADDPDDGSDTLGTPDFSEVVSDFTKLTALGFDGLNTSDTSDDVGGSIVLGFTDNVCLDGPGPDIRLFEGGKNEAAHVEISTDGGQTFTMIGIAGPANNFELDVNGAAAEFQHVRITSADFAGKRDLAGFDFDAIECINSAKPTTPPPPTTKASLESCDLAAGGRGIDVKNVSLSSNGSQLVVKAQFCGPVEEKAYYKVYFDYSREQAHHRRNYGSWYLRRYFKQHDKKHDKKHSKKYGGLDLPVIDPSAPDGPDTLDGNELCQRTWDDRAAYRYGRTWGPGEIELNGDELTLTLDYSELTKGDGVQSGSKVLVWVRSWEYGFRDRAPNVETGDRCARPQFEHEVFAITLD